MEETRGRDGVAFAPWAWAGGWAPAASEAACLAPGCAGSAAAAIAAHGAAAGRRDPGRMGSAELAATSRAGSAGDTWRHTGNHAAKEAPRMGTHPHPHSIEPGGPSRGPSPGPGCPAGTAIPWLDPATASGVADVVASLAAGHPEATAVLLFGSVARREERHIDDPQPSDVDLLVLVDPAALDPAALDPAAERLTLEQELALYRTIGEADYRRREAPREIAALLARRAHLADDWDPTFVEHVARDGLLLWARPGVPLPAPLAAIAASNRAAARAADDRARRPDEP